MLAWDVGSARIVGTLLLLDQLVEPHLLVNCQGIAEFYFGALNLFTHARSDRLHELLRALLAGHDDLIYALALRDSQIQFPLGAAQKLNARTASGHWLDWTLYVVVRANLWRKKLHMLRITNKQTAGYDTGRENDHSGQNDLPGVHQMESAGG